MYQKDSNTVSLLWGRIGAAILLLISVALGSFGYTFAEEDQVAVYEAISTILASIAFFQVLISKIRESGKAKEDK
jgi:membrane protein YdbS with pleckstrin-like domain